MLQWELKISAPKDSKEDLIELISYYQTRLFELQTNERYGKLLNLAVTSEEFNNLSEAEKRYINMLKRHYENYKKIPVKFYSEYAKLKNMSNLTWSKAKEKNDYSLFKPYLEKNY